nr:hypothetical protein C5F59_09885 [Streptomyces sp. QL37]
MVLLMQRICDQQMVVGGAAREQCTAGDGFLGSFERCFPVVVGAVDDVYPRLLCRQQTWGEARQHTLCAYCFPEEEQLKCGLVDGAPGFFHPVLVLGLFDQTQRLGCMLHQVGTHLIECATGDDPEHSGWIPRVQRNDAGIRCGVFRRSERLRPRGPTGEQKRQFFGCCVRSRS